MNPEVIITNLKKRYTGVSGTINALLPAQSKSLKIGFVGADLPGARLARQQNPENFIHLSLWQAVLLSRKRLPDGRRRIWHVRRDPEMLLAILLRDVLRLPIRIVFTSAAKRKHSWFPRWMIERMDAVIATTPEAASFVRYGAIVPHGVDITRFTPPRDKLAAWSNSKLPGKYGIGTFGRIRPEKGTDIFVDAMLQVLPDFPDFTAVIAGLCQPQFSTFKEALEQRIADKRLDKRILFIGEIPADQMPDWYENVLITVASPRYEGYGLTVLEGMACGCAIVASDTGIFRKVVEESDSGQVVPVDDTPALADALRLLMQDPNQCVRLGKNGCHHLEMNYSSVSEAESIRNVFRETWLS
jgi:mannosyltransferase